MNRSANPHRLLILALGVAGALHWVAFFGGGRFDLSVSDWPRQVAYFDTLASAVRGGYLPLQLSEPIYDVGADFFANLEVPLTPQTWLFALAGTGVGAMLTTIVMAWIGLYGCVRLARRCDLSAPAFVALVLLSGYNGYIVGHIGAGHLGWVGCYALPFVIEGVLAMHAAGRSRSRAPVATAVVLALIVFQGSLHIAVITWMVLLLLALTHTGLRTQIGICLAWFTALSAFRLLPAVVVFWPAGRPWIADGYRSVVQVLEGVLLVRPPFTGLSSGVTLLYGERGTVPLRWLEYDLYIGVVGALAVVLFVLVPMVRRFSADEAATVRESALATLHLPLLVLAALSCWRVYGMVIPAPVSLLSVERVPTRFLGVALIFALTLACIRFDTWWRSAPRSASDAAMAVAALLFLVSQLAYHSFVVSPMRDAAYAATLTPFTGVNTAVSLTAYPVALAIGLVVTVVVATRAVVRLRQPVGAS